jgi:hypothetical protein
MPGLDDRDYIITWRPDGGSLLVYRPMEMPSRVERLDLSTGERRLFRELAPVDRAGAICFYGAPFSADEKSYAYAFDRGVDFGASTPSSRKDEGPKMRPRWKKVILIAPLAILGMALFVAIGGGIVQLLWNWLLPPLAGWREIGFWQALGILALCRILIRWAWMAWSRSLHRPAAHGGALRAPDPGGAGTIPPGDAQTVWIRPVRRREPGAVKRGRPGRGSPGGQRRDGRWRAGAAARPSTSSRGAWQRHAATIRLRSWARVTADRRTRTAGKPL